MSNKEALMQKEINALKKENSENAKELKAFSENEDKYIKRLKSKDELASRQQELIDELQKELQSCIVPMEVYAISSHILKLVQRTDIVNQQLILKQVNYNFLLALQKKIDEYKNSLGCFEKTKELASFEFNKLSKGEIFFS